MGISSYGKFRNFLIENFLHEINLALQVYRATIDDESDQGGGQSNAGNPTRGPFYDQYGIGKKLCKSLVAANSLISSSLSFRRLDLKGCSWASRGSE